MLSCPSSNKHIQSQSTRYIPALHSPPLRILPPHPSPSGCTLGQTTPQTAQPSPLSLLYVSTSDWCAAIPWHCVVCTRTIPLLWVGRREGFGREGAGWGRATGDSGGGGWRHYCVNACHIQPTNMQHLPWWFVSLQCLLSGCSCPQAVPAPKTA